MSEGKQDEFSRWMTAANHTRTGTEYDWEDMEEAFYAGMETEAQQADEREPDDEPVKIAVAVPGGEQTFTADGWTLTEGTLFVNRKGVAVGVFPPGMWLYLRYPNADAKADL